MSERPGPPPFAFTGVVMAGGRSTRMGRDKTRLRLPDGQPLWEHQAAKLAEAGAAEVLISCRADQSRNFVLPETGGVPVRTVFDTAANAGPMAGLAAVLKAASYEMVLVLAVDLPDATAGHLHLLLSQCRPPAGAVIKRGGFFEPLFAVYPKAAAEIPARLLEEVQFSLQALVREIIAKGLVAELPADPLILPALRNVNAPQDWPE